MRHAPCPPRPRLSGRIARYALAGGFGLACVVIGGSGFVVGKGALIAGFPGSLAEAVACAAGGMAVVFWAVARIRREWRPPGREMPAGHAAGPAARHPDKPPAGGD